jgi:energy-coupling factor transporter ATP-binding protein EcfA2
MKLRSLQLRNFRTYLDETVYLDDLTVIVGANDTGKSTILEAIRFLLSPHTFSGEAWSYERLRTQSVSWDAPLEPVRVLVEFQTGEGGAAPVRVGTALGPDRTGDGLPVGYSGPHVLNAEPDGGETFSLDGFHWSPVDADTTESFPALIELGGSESSGSPVGAVLHALVRDRLEQALRESGASLEWLDDSAGAILQAIAGAYGPALSGYLPHVYDVIAEYTDPDTSWSEHFLDAMADVVLTRSALDVIRHGQEDVSVHGRAADPLAGGSESDLGQGTRRLAAFAALSLYLDPDLWST